ncbi:MAG: FAD-dependent oxidoreductase, partial [Dehalococcoidia bacterium]|nr:FAD-dependent oxidoreductase [Dehalococcoidia bacterium]
FDAGATLAGGFRPGGPHARVAAQLGLDWPVRPVEPAMVVHLPEKSIFRYADPDAWAAERARVFPGADRFWQAQERTADAVWSLADRLPPWPPETLGDLVALARGATLRDLTLAPLVTRKTAHYLRDASADLRAFVDAQLLISAQATAAETIWLYGATALDLARQGVVEARGGIGGIATTLVAALRRDGGRFLTKREVIGLRLRNGRVTEVVTNKGEVYPADVVIANMTPWDLARVLGEAAPAKLTAAIATRPVGWGAFTLYLGVEADVIPPGFPTHHQIIVDPTRPLGEGNSVFVSISPEWDTTRAPSGRRAITVSTHTAVAPWWRLDRAAYHERRDAYCDRLLRVVGQLLPGLAGRITVLLPGTPRTFHRFVRREQGAVGGFGQRSLFSNVSPRTGVPNLFLVGDSIFPGQSTAAVSLGAMRVAELARRAAVHP